MEWVEHKDILTEQIAWWIINAAKRFKSMAQGQLGKHLCWRPSCRTSAWYDAKQPLLLAQNWIKKLWCFYHILKVFLQNKEENCLKKKWKKSTLLYLSLFLCIMVKTTMLIAFLTGDFRWSETILQQRILKLVKSMWMCEWMANTLHKYFYFSWRFNLTAGLVVHFQTNTYVGFF